MSLTLLDWLIVAMGLVGLAAVALHTNKYNKSIADFLAAGRAAGRYMLTVGGGMVWIGVINIVAMFELYYAMGPVGMWWVLFTTPIGIYLAVSGWAIYRFRETRALTILQFLEERYNHKVRVLAGVLAWTTGMMSFGIYPAVASRFFIHFCGLPLYVSLWGMQISLFLVIMFVLIGLSLIFVFWGGQITIIVTDFLQSAFAGIAALFIVVFLAATTFDWSRIVETLKMAPPNASMLNPIHSGGVKDFNVGYFFVGAVTAFYCVLSNSIGSQAYNASAKSAHEFRLGQVMAQWRWLPMCLFFMVLVLMSYTYLHHPYYADSARQINGALNQVSPDMNNAVRNQLTVPVALAFILPMGLRGLMCAIMMCALIASCDTLLHAYGSVFVQDIVLPLRRRPLETKAHMNLLKISILGVAVFSFCFSWLYPQRQSILMYWALSYNIWLGGAGAVVLGGLYWRYGTPAAAITSMIIGAVISIAALVCIQVWPLLYKSEFPINGQWVFFFTVIICIIAYISVSLWSGKKAKAYNLDKLLHRGKYKVAETQAQDCVHEKVAWWQRIFGITGEFTAIDRLTVYVIIGWFLAWVVIFFVGTTYAMLVETSDDSWAKFWFVYLCLLFVVGIITAVWFTWGGFRDVGYMFRMLRTMKRDYSDDGQVHKDTADDAKPGQPERKIKSEQLDFVGN